MKTLRIGIDFDNTIVSYDRLFHTIAREWDVIPPDLPARKLAVRDYLRRANQEARWTEMQGVVYGTRMDEAGAYPHVVDFLKWAHQVGHEVCIISHKTRYPFLGPQVDLHAAARLWVDHHLCINDIPLVPASRVSFELTQQDKLARIDQTHCDVFIDDLPEILLATNFPTHVSRILFDPDQHHADLPLDIIVIRSWYELSQYLS